MARWESENPAGGMQLALRALTAAMGGEGAGDLPRPVELSPGVVVPDRMTSAFRDPSGRVRVEVDVVVTTEAVPVVRKLVVETEDDDRRGIDRDRLRGIPVADLIRWACADWSLADVDGRWSAGAKASAKAEDELPRGGRRALTHEYLSDVADVYSNHPGNAPTQAVATAFGLAPSTAAKHVLKARRAGLLPETDPGRATNREDE